jgi:hypothetical protein
LWHDLKDKGIDEKPKLEIKRRQASRTKKDNAMRVISCDVLDLYLYCSGLTDTFPKDTIAPGCIGRYVQLSHAAERKEPLVGPECNGGTHILLLAAIEDMKKHISNQEGVINMLTNRVKTLEELMNTVQVDVTKMKSIDKKEEADNKNDLSFIFEHPETIEGDGEIPVNDHVANEPDNKKTNTKVKCASLSSEIASAIEIMDDGVNMAAGNGNEDTQQNPNGESQVNQDIGDIDQSEVQQDDAPETKLFSGVVQTPGPWYENKNKKDTQKLKAGNNIKVTVQRKNAAGRDSRVVKSHSSDNVTLILGARHEASTTLYLKNLCTEDKTDEQLCRDVRKYGRHVGLRIMHAEVVHNKFCQDVVGCRIRVPNSQVDSALSAQTWPDDLVCRMWESRISKGPKGRNGRFNQYG